MDAYRGQLQRALAPMNIGLQAGSPLNTLLTGGSEARGWAMEYLSWKASRRA